MITSIKIIVEMFTYLYCLAELFGRKLKISIHAVVLIISILFILTGLNDYDFPEYLRSLIYISIFLYGLLYYGESVKLTIVNCFLAAVIITVLQLLLLLPLYNIYFEKFGQGEVNELLINMGCFLLVVLCSCKIKLRQLSDLVIKRNRLIVSVSILVLCGLAVNFYQMKDEAKVFGAVYIQMVYFILLFLFVIYEWQKSKMDVEKKKAQLEMNKLYYGAYDQLITLVRERQHDMKSHINAILSMIYTTDNYDELITKQKEYCKYVMGQTEQIKLVLSTENPLIAGFLYSKILEAQKQGIEVDYHVEMPKNSAVIPEYELVEMIGILIDNAIEALRSRGEDEDSGKKEESQKIKLMIKETENDMELTVANTSNHYEEDITAHFFEAGYSSKGKERGIGLSKLKRMVHDKQGNIVVSNELYEERNYLVFTIKLIKRKRQKS